MFPVVVAPLDEGMLTLPVHVLCPLTDGVPYILQCGVLQDDDQLRELSVHFADLLPYVGQYLITILLSPFMFGQAGIVDILCDFYRSVDDSAVHAAAVRPEHHRNGVCRSIRQNRRNLLCQVYRPFDFVVDAVQISREAYRIMELVEVVVELAQVFVGGLYLTPDEDMAFGNQFLSVSLLLQGSFSTVLA